MILFLLVSMSISTIATYRLWILGRGMRAGDYQKRQAVGGALVLFTALGLLLLTSALVFFC